MHLLAVYYTGRYALGFWIAYTWHYTVSTLLQVQPWGGELDMPMHAKVELYKYCYCFILLIEHQSELGICSVAGL